MNPRQRRGVILVALAAIGAVAVFVAVASFVSDVRAEVGPTASVLRLRADVAAFEPISLEMVEEVEVPQRWMSARALQRTPEISGMVAGTDLTAGSVLQDGMVIPPPALEPGQREVAILVDAETGVAGKITSGSSVDILATFPATQDQAASSQVIVSGARIIDVGLPTAQAGVDASGAFAQEQVVPVTFALTVQEGLVLTYAESFASNVRLALVGAGDTDAIPSAQRRFSLDDDGGVTVSPTSVGGGAGG
jgi:pilus assembly protein CpaB